MALITDVAKRVEIPHEPQHWMELKRLSWRQEELARDVRAENMMKQMKQMGADMVVALRKIAKEQDENRGKNPYTEYDQLFVLQAGIISWSYEEDVSKDTIEMLDSETANWAFEQILGLSDPRSEEDQKNG